MPGKASPQEVQGVVSVEAASQSLPVWEVPAVAEPLAAEPAALGPLPVWPEAVELGPVLMRPAAAVLPPVEPGRVLLQRPWQPLFSPVPARRDSRSDR